MRVCLQKPVFIPLGTSSLILAVFIQRLSVCFPARAAQCYSDSLGADIKNTVAGQIHLVLQSPEH